MLMFMCVYVCCILAKNSAFLQDAGGLCCPLPSVVDEFWCLWREVQFGRFCPQPQARPQRDCRCFLLLPAKCLSATCADLAQPQHNWLFLPYPRSTSYITSGVSCRINALVAGAVLQLPTSSHAQGPLHEAARALSACSTRWPRTSRHAWESTPAACSCAASPLPPSPSTRHLLAVSLSDAFQLCCPGYESHVSDT